MYPFTFHSFKAKMTSEAFFKHFTAVADASPVPVVLYNVPANTGVDMDWSVAARLAKHPNIIGMKESNGDVTKIGRLIYETRQDDFQVGWMVFHQGWKSTLPFL